MYRGLKRVGLPGVILGISLVGAGCNNTESKGQSTSLLTITQITANGPDGQEGNVLASDVITIVNDVPTVIEDQGAVSVRNLPLNPDDTTASNWQDVLLKRYRVTYTRADNRGSVPGVDVPWPFEAPVTINIEVNSTTEFGIILVRAVAKSEPPLIQLAEGGIGEDQILTTATIEFWGNDLAGHPVYIKGTIAVHFANWADTQ